MSYMKNNPLGNWSLSETEVDRSLSRKCGGFFLFSEF